MAEIINRTPRQDGFYMPAESDPQSSVCLVWPDNLDTWRAQAKPAQRAFVEVAENIAKTSSVKVLANPASLADARDQLPDSIDVISIENNDSWLRDTGCSFLRNAIGERRAVAWQFNAWGGHMAGMFEDWQKDDAVAAQLAASFNADVYHAPLILEGGSIHVDGEGTCFTTEECLLHPSRNPSLSKAEIEDYLKQYLNVDVVFWLPQGLYGDIDTNGHIDNLMHVVKPGEVILTWCDDPNDPQYAISRAAEAALLAKPDAKGRDLYIHKLPMPGPLYISTEEAESFSDNVHESRHAGARLAASYANFLIINHQVLYPLLDSRYDNQATDILQQAFPNYQIIGIKAGREILLGGGNVHCITQQVI
ncbi:MAG: agmatine deiminase [Pseudomonadales bacterium]|nr:agmatine deiminase [Pseudomonadales bacterium]